MSYELTLKDYLVILGFWGLGFRVLGLGFDGLRGRGWVSRFRVFELLRLGVGGWGLRVGRFAVWVSRFGLFEVSRLVVLASGFQVQGSRFEVRGLGFRVRGI